MPYPASSTTKPVRRANGRNLLLCAASIAVIATILPQPAQAQSFQGTPSVTIGTATVNNSPGNTVVNINDAITVINWQPNDVTGTGEIAFQPAGTTAVFSSTVFSDFAVLNRILPVDAAGNPVITRPVRFDGTVNSIFDNSVIVPAGSIWFYTPGGIILGGTSAFNVGSLVLSTSDIDENSLFFGNNGTINFTGTPNGASAINLETGAQVNALINGSSYVAMVAPRIVQNGVIQVDGSIALVAAEAVDITMSSATGLFDIAVSVGTGDPNGIVHGATGSTGGPGSGGAADPQQIYMVAIPKNSAINMLVNGSVGYSPAATASVQNGEVVLSAGYDIINGTVDLGEHAVPNGAAPANISIGETSTTTTSFSTRTTARASGNLVATAGAALLSFSSDANLYGDISSGVNAAANEIVTVGGNLTISSQNGGQGGNASLTGTGGQITIGGDLIVDASSTGYSGQTSGILFTNLTGGNGQGGSASLNMTGGLLTVGGATKIDATGIGGYGTQTMGNGSGGTANVVISGATNLTNFPSSLDILADGWGIISYLNNIGNPVLPPTEVIGGNGTGGTASAIIGNGAVANIGDISVSATGTGDVGGDATSVATSNGGNGGNGTGGNASLSFTNGLFSPNSIFIDTSAVGGNGGGGITNLGGTGGNAVAGNTTLAIGGNGADINTGNAVLLSNAFGGDGGFGPSAAIGANGGNAVAGTTNIAISNGAAAALTSIDLQALGVGGFGGGSGGAIGGNGGNGTGGSAGLTVNGATATSDVINIDAGAFGGFAASGGNDGTLLGGDAFVSAISGDYSTNNSFVTTDTPEGTAGVVTISTSSNASGISGTLSLGDTMLNSNGDSDGPVGIGGSVIINNDNANPAGGEIGFTQLNASAFGSIPATGVNGIFIRANGSDILVDLDAFLTTSGEINIDAIGQGSFSTMGNLNAFADNDIILTHAGQTGAVPTVGGSTVTFFTSTNFDAQSGTIIEASDQIDITAFTGNASADQLNAPNNINMVAAGDIMLGSANGSNGNVALQAGRIQGQLPDWQLATATISGDVMAGALFVDSGGDIVISGPANISVANNIILNSGDDIVINNAIINSAQSATSNGDIQLNAGAIIPNNPVTGNLHSIIIANSTLSSPGFDFTLNADAIDAETGNINANRLTATVNNAPAPGVVGGNDGGTLSANCLAGNICLGAVNTPTQILIGPATGTVGIANNVTISGSLASNDISIRARDSVSFTGSIDINAANNLFIAALNGPVNLTGTAMLTAGNLVNLFAGMGGINGPAAALVSGGDVGLFGDDINLGSVNAAGAVNTIANDGSIVSAGSLDVTGNIAITGFVTVGGGNVILNAGGGIATGGIMAINGNLTARGTSFSASSVDIPGTIDILVTGNASLGNTVSDDITIAADGLAAFTGIISAPNIMIYSGDIAIAPGAQLGTIGVTQNIFLTTSAGAQMTIGGPGVTGGYSLSGAEFASIFANDIDIAWTNALASLGQSSPPPIGGITEPNIILDDFTISSRANNPSGNLAADGSLSIFAPGMIDIIGAAKLTGAGNSNGIFIRAGQALQIVANRGSIGIDNGSSGRAGILDLSGSDIIAASSFAISDLAGQTDLSAISARLGYNDGNVNLAGIISADTVNLSATDHIFVQNSGANGLIANRRGIGTNALNIYLSNPNGQIAINGQISGTTGIDAIPLATINDAPSQQSSGFDTRSTMNGCQILAISSCRETNIPVVITEDKINNPLDPGGLTPADQLPAALIELKKFESFGYPPLIDEPVTGAGNDDLWPATCNDDDDSACNQITETTQ